MTTYDFQEILFNGEKYLGIKANRLDIFVYRCSIHKSIISRKDIVSYRRIPGKKGVRKALFPFKPILFGEMGDITGITKGTFNYANRENIRDHDPDDLTEQHLRYQGWQIYLFAGDTTLKDCSLPGLWELIPIDIQEPPIDPNDPSIVTRPPGYGP